MYVQLRFSQLWHITEKISLKVLCTCHVLYNWVPKKNIYEKWFSISLYETWGQNFFFELILLII